MGPEVHAISQYIIIGLLEIVVVSKNYSLCSLKVPGIPATFVHCLCILVYAI